MRLMIDDTEYQVNLRKVADHLCSFYIENSKKLQAIEVSPGKVLDFSRKSLMRTAIKSALVPLVIPVVELLYKSANLEPPKREKHEDLIDWMVLRIIEFGGKIEGGIQLNATTAKIRDDNEGNRRKFESISTHGTIIFRKNQLTTPKPDEVGKCEESQPGIQQERDSKIT